MTNRHLAFPLLSRVSSTISKNFKELGMGHSTEDVVGQLTGPRLHDISTSRPRIKVGDIQSAEQCACHQKVWSGKSPLAHFHA